MTPRMRELYERCVANDGAITSTFVKQSDKWCLTHLKRQRWIETEPDGEGEIRVRVIRFPRHQRFIKVKSHGS